MMTWLLGFLLFCIAAEAQVVKILVTKNPCDFRKDTQVYPSLDGDTHKYTQCGQSGTYWLIPCQPGTNFDLEAEACIRPEDVAVVTVERPPPVAKVVERPQPPQPIVKPTSTAAATQLPSDLGLFKETSPTVHAVVDNFQQPNVAVKPAAPRFTNTDFPLEQTKPKPTQKPEPPTSQSFLVGPNSSPNNFAINKPIITTYPVELTKTCKEGSVCPHNTEMVYFCLHPDPAKYYQCTPNGWVARSCPLGLNFAGDHCDAIGSRSTENINTGLINKGTPYEPIIQTIPSVPFSQMPQIYPQPQQPIPQPIPQTYPQPQQPIPQIPTGYPQQIPKLPYLNIPSMLIPPPTYPTSKFLPTQPTYRPTLDPIIQSLMTAYPTYPPNTYPSATSPPTTTTTTAATTTAAKINIQVDLASTTPTTKSNKDRGIMVPMTPSNGNFIQLAFEGGKCSLLSAQKSGVAANFSDLNTFFMCVPPRNSWAKALGTEGQWVKMRCPEELTFNPNLKVCDRMMITVANPNSAE